MTGSKLVDLMCLIQMKKLPCILLFFYCLLPTAYCQLNLDSLWAVWNDESQADTVRLKAMDDIAWYFLYVNPDSSLIFGKRGLLLAQEKNLKRWEAMALNVIGGSFSIKGNYQKAIEYYSTSVRIQIEIRNKKGEAAALNNIALAYSDQGDYPKSLEYYFKGLRIEEKIDNKEGQALTLSNIGIVYKDQDDLSKALEYYSKALEMDKALERKEGIAASLCNIGIVYQEQGEYKKALDYFNKYLKMTEELGIKQYQAKAYGNIGTVHYEQGNYKEALDYFFKHLKISEEIGSKQDEITALGNIGALYTETDRFAEAEKYLHQALSLANDIGTLDDIQLNHEVLSELYVKTGHHKLALEHYKAHITARDSLINEQNTKEITQREMQYDFDKQQEKEQAEQEKKDAIAAEQLKREKTIGYAFMGGFGLLLVLAFVILRSLRQKKKANKLITEQKQEVEHQKDLVDEKNQEITDSITYAQRIQEAILPPDRIVKEYLKESFIYYKPKDIVAGDFYWMETAPPPQSPSPKGEGEASPLRGDQGGLVLFAAADCTGHGVPGAMVSVVCHNALNRAVREFNLTEPGKILDKVRELVIETFHAYRQAGEKSDHEVKDGMDIALCRLDLTPGPSPNTGEGSGAVLHYAGANNPLWVLRKGINDIEELEETRADKQPIGKYAEAAPFTTHTVELNAGDSFYIFTDGFPDQFGGPKGKKFKYKPFKRLLLEGLNKPMEEQRTTISQSFGDWRGELEQVDDVCVIGVRV